MKAQSASVLYTFQGEQYLLNMIDTPGHVDFSYEVTRSLRACQGVVLLVDANQGVQAQTVSNFYLAFANNLHLIAAMNKIDLPGADPEKVRSGGQVNISLLYSLYLSESRSSPCSSWTRARCWRSAPSWAPESEISWTPWSP